MALLALLGVLSWRQSRMYGDVETLYRTTVDRNPDCWLAHNNLGAVLFERGEVEEAIDHYKRAIELKPDYDLAHNNLGLVLAERGQFSDAIAEYRKALTINPDYEMTHNNLGLALAGGGDLAGAIAEYQRALAIKPGCAVAHNSLGAALAQRGEVAAAAAEFRTAGGHQARLCHGPQQSRLSPGRPRRDPRGHGALPKGGGNQARLRAVQIGLAMALAGSGRPGEAIVHFQGWNSGPACQHALQPCHGRCAYSGRFDEAIVHYGKALEIKPEFPESAFQSRPCPGHSGKIRRGRRNITAKCSASRPPTTTRPSNT